MNLSALSGCNQPRASIIIACPFDGGDNGVPAWRPCNPLNPSRYQEREPARRTPVLPLRYKHIGIFGLIFFIPTMSDEFCFFLIASGRFIRVRYFIECLGYERPCFCRRIILQACFSIFSDPPRETLFQNLPVHSIPLCILLQFPRVRYLHPLHQPVSSESTPAPFKVRNRE